MAFRAASIAPSERGYNVQRIVAEASTAPLLQALDGELDRCFPAILRGRSFSDLVFAAVAEIYSLEEPDAIATAQYHYTASSENERTAAVQAVFKKLFTELL